MVKNKVLQVRITETLLNRFDKVLEKKGRTRASVIENMVHEYCEKHEKEINTK